MKKVLSAALAVLVLPLLASCSPTPSPDAGSAPRVGEVNCAYTASGEASKQVNPPPATGVPNTGSTSAVLSLNGKPVGLTLDRAKAPCTVNSFVSLAQQGFFDGTSCHRLGNREGFQMLQCGDPTGTGRGGPGYEFADELTGSETYPAGTLAMANAGPNTNVSQFFITTVVTPWLDGKHVVFGEVTEGSDIVKAIEALGSSSGRPSAKVVVEDCGQL